MSAVANPATVPAVATRSRLARLWRLTVGLKIVMAVTGVILSGFVLVHMAGNLQVFQGAEGARRLRQAAPHGAGLALAGAARAARSVGLHIAAWLVLCRATSRRGRSAYRKVTHRESSFASRSMRWTGPLLARVHHLPHPAPDHRDGPPDFHEGARLPQPGHRVAGGAGGGHLRAGDGGARVPPLARRLEPVPDPRGEPGPLRVARAPVRRRFSPWWSCWVSSPSRSRS